MKIVAVIQARMSSRRLPGKVLLPLAGMPVLAHVVRRARASDLVDHVCVATSRDPSDDAIANWCKQERVDCFRGSLDDVLERYVEAGQNANADAVVRITADCPALDPAIVSLVIRGFLEGQYDYYSLSGDFPDGLDVAVISMKAIYRAHAEAVLASDREHVGPYIERNTSSFRVGGLTHFHGRNLAHHRWTLDEPADLMLLSRIFDALQQKPLFSAEDVIELLEKNPGWLELNAYIIRNEGYLRSIALEGE